MKTLKNKSRVVRVFNLPHAEFCGASCTCETVTTKLHVETESGKSGTREVTRKLAGSITFLAGETRRDIPDELLKVVAVKAALAQGVLRLIE